MTALLPLQQQQELHGSVGDQDWSVSVGLANGQVSGVCVPTHTMLVTDEYMAAAAAIGWATIDSVWWYLWCSLFDASQLGNGMSD